MSIQLLQEPVKITLEKRHVLRVSGCKRRLVENKEEMIYVPLLLTLERLLNNDSIMNQVGLNLWHTHVCVHVFHIVHVLHCVLHCMCL